VPVTPTECYRTGQLGNAFFCQGKRLDKRVPIKMEWIPNLLDRCGEPLLS
jgi:hypothetical protein